jgi:Glu-tRNA(Gln) amidotransferase subunit E-like FAD-binding protein
MKLEFDASELLAEDNWGPNLQDVLRDATRDVVQKFVKKMVQEELDKVAEPVRAIINKKATLLLQQAMDEVRDLPDTTIMDALLSRKL